MMVSSDDTGLPGPAKFRIAETEDDGSKLLWALCLAPKQGSLMKDIATNFTRAVQIMVDPCKMNFRVAKPCMILLKYRHHVGCETRSFWFNDSDPDAMATLANMVLTRESDTTGIIERGEE